MCAVERFVSARDTINAVLQEVTLPQLKEVQVAVIGSSSANPPSQKEDDQDDDENDEDDEEEEEDEIDPQLSRLLKQEEELVRWFEQAMDNERIRHVLKFRPKVKEKSKELRKQFPEHPSSVALRKRVRWVLR